MAPAETAKPASAADVPATYGRFRLTGRIGVGGMAEVFRAVVKGPQGWERELVVKRILPQLSGNAEFTKMFIREAKISALLVHPNIVQTFEFGEAEGTYFIAMEGVQGVTLRELLTKLKKEQRAMPFMVIADIAKQVCTGLDYAHTLTGPDGTALEIVHQDVSPTNIMLAFNGTVKILDFGIARAASFAEEEAKKGLIKGKVAYLAPEQVNMQPFDHRIDIFALGIVMHEMMTGARLFQAKNDVAKMRQLLAAPIPPPSSINAAVPRELDRIVMKALEVDPTQRYQSATAMAGDLERTMIAARHSSRDLAKLLRGLFMDEAEERRSSSSTRSRRPCPSPWRAAHGLDVVGALVDAGDLEHRSHALVAHEHRRAASSTARCAPSSRACASERHARARPGRRSCSSRSRPSSWAASRLWPRVAPFVHELLAAAAPAAAAARAAHAHRRRAARREPAPVASPAPQEAHRQEGRKGAQRARRARASPTTS